MMTFATMKAVRRWLVASPEKVPHYADGTRRSGQLDTPEDVGQLASYADARAALAQCRAGWHLGFALGSDDSGNHWQGIDFDAVEDNLLSCLMPDLPGYVETSPSGNGFHAIGYGRSFRSLGSNGSGIEAYAAGRYFTVTENALRDSPLTCIADHVENKLAQHHRALSAAALRQKSVAESTVEVGADLSPRIVTDIRSALNYMRADEYGLWVEIGHALKLLGNTGRGLWLDWSATSQKFDPQIAAQKWDGFAPTQTSFRAVFAKAQEYGWVNPASNAAQIASAPTGDDAAYAIRAKPFKPPAATDIPPRPWVFGHWLLRGTVTTIIAPGGVGKSSFAVAMAMSLASGRPLLGKDVWGGAQRVWLWNLEDDGDELARQIVAASLHYRLQEADYAARLFVNDASSSLVTATKRRDGLDIHAPVNAALVNEIRARKIDVLTIDPFVSSHHAEENDNGQIDAIAKAWACIAREANCSIALVHHSRKLAGQQVDAEAARGASALGNAARSVLVLNRMEKAEAVRVGISEDDRRRYFRVSNDKSNRAPAEQAEWFHLASVRLANGGFEGGDDLGVVERWKMPDMTADFDHVVRRKIQDEILGGEWRSHISANHWAGHAVAKIIAADLSIDSEKKRTSALLKDMISKEQLLTEQRPDASRHIREYVIAGKLVEMECDSPMW